METTTYGKILFYASVLSVVYFLFLYVNGITGIFDFVLVGVFQELLTLPLMAVQFLICVTSLIFWVKGGFSFKAYTFWAFLISAINCGVVIGSFMGS